MDSIYSVIAKRVTRVWTVTVHENGLVTSPGWTEGGMPAVFTDRLDSLFMLLHDQVMLDGASPVKRLRPEPTSAISIDLSKLQYGRDMSALQEVDKLKRLAIVDSLNMLLVPVPEAHGRRGSQEARPFRHIDGTTYACDGGYEKGTPVVVVAMVSGDTVAIGNCTITDDGMWRRPYADSTRAISVGWVFTPPGWDVRKGRQWYAIR
jgi:hypothetical protein